MVKYEKITCDILGLQGVFPVTYLAGINNTEIYNEIVVFEADGCFYIWKVLNFRQLLKSLSEISQQAFEGIVKGYKKISTSPVDKNRYRKINFDNHVGAGDYFPLAIRGARLDLRTDNTFRQTIEKMLSEQ